MTVISVSACLTMFGLPWGSTGKTHLPAMQETIYNAGDKGHTDLISRW